MGDRILGLYLISISDRENCLQCSKAPSFPSISITLHIVFNSLLFILKMLVHPYALYFDILPVLIDVQYKLQFLAQILDNNAVGHGRLGFKPNTGRNIVVSLLK